MVWVARIGIVAAIAMCVLCVVLQKWFMAALFAANAVSFYLNLLEETR